MGDGDQRVARALRELESLFVGYGGDCPALQRYYAGIDAMPEKEHKAQFLAFFKHDEADACFVERGIAAPLGRALTFGFN